MEEKRYAHRWTLSLAVRYAGMMTNGEGACNTHDINTLGARMMLQQRHNVGDKLCLLIEIPGKSVPADIRAQVVWQKSAGEDMPPECFSTGVVFTSITDHDKKDLLSCISAHCPEEFRRHWWEGIF